MGATNHPSRRTFLTTSASATAVSLFDIVSSRVLASPAPSDTIALGHIGIGGRGRGFLVPEAEAMGGKPASSNLGGDGTRMKSPARSVALCDIDSGRMDKAASVVGGQPRLYKDFRKLLEQKDLDAVVIAAPDHWHALLTVMACMAGKDVYCEKPACNTIEEGRAMVTAAERYDRVVQIGSQGRSQLAAYQAARYVRNGQLGKVGRVACWHYANPAGDWTPDAAAPPELDYETWVGPARWLPFNAKRTHGSFRWMIEFGGGQIRDRGAHVMSIAMFVMDADHTGPVRITATGEPHHDGMYDTPNTMNVTYEFKNPDWTLVWAQPGEPSKELEARYGAIYHGDKGKLTVTLGDGAGTATEQKAKDYTPPCDGPPVYKSPGHMEDFYDCIKSRKKPIMHIEAGHRVAALCVLGNIAYLLGRPLEWDPVGERVANDDEANRMLSRPGRGPWHL
ncbi:MAG: Gfo/Idh/MocA family oxidoreductase [Acidobacteria bacterium]|nr:Gfo/Idh/MocA family oxidoreductase [Acidobacteriota bacterium]